MQSAIEIYQNLAKFEPNPMQEELFSCIFKQRHESRTFAQSTYRQWKNRGCPHPKSGF